jgi:hypothetical protein
MHRWKDNTEMGLLGTGFKGVDWWAIECDNEHLCSIKGTDFLTS